MSVSHNVFGGKLYYYFYYAQKFGMEEIRSRELTKENTCVIQEEENIRARPQAELTLGVFKGGREDTERLPRVADKKL